MNDPTELDAQRTDGALLDQEAAEAMAKMDAKFPKSEHGGRILKLRHAVQVYQGQPAVTEIRFRAVRAKDLRDFPVDTKEIAMGHLLTLATRIYDQPAPVIDMLHGRDRAEVLELVGFLLGNFLGVGG